MFVIILINVIDYVLNSFIALSRTVSGFYPFTPFVTVCCIHVYSYCKLQSAVLICTIHISMLNVLMLLFWCLFILSFNIALGQISFASSWFQTSNSCCSHGLWKWNRQSVPKRWNIKFRHWGITQRKITTFFYFIFKTVACLCLTGKWFYEY